MSKAYWIADIDVLDPASHPQYLDAATEAVRAHGGQFLVRGGSAETVEGQTRSRHVLVEFPSLAAANDCYRSPEYQRAKTLRQSWSVADIVIVEGV